MRHLLIAIAGLMAAQRLTRLQPRKRPGGGASNFRLVPTNLGLTVNFW